MLLFFIPYTSHPKNLVNHIVILFSKWLLLKQIRTTKEILYFVASTTLYHQTPNNFYSLLISNYCNNFKRFFTCCITKAATHYNQRHEWRMHTCSNTVCTIKQRRKKSRSFKRRWKEGFCVFFLVLQLRWDERWPAINLQCQ